VPKLIPKSFLGYSRKKSPLFKKLVHDFCPNLLTFLIRNLHTQTTLTMSQFTAFETSELLDMLALQTEELRTLFGGKEKQSTREFNKDYQERRNIIKQIQEEIGSRQPNIITSEIMPSSQPPTVI
jgi:hypothetical protein